MQSVSGRPNLATRHDATAHSELCEQDMHNIPNERERDARFGSSIWRPCPSPSPYRLCRRTLCLEQWKRVQTNTSGSKGGHFGEYMFALPISRDLLGSDGRQIGRMKSVMGTRSFSRSSAISLSKFRKLNFCAMARNTNRDSGRTESSHRLCSPNVTLIMNHMKLENGSRSQLELLISQKV
uniref:Uncharacterized protein n=1 Tax=Anopheles farauti TaxID=69004 RepID=A0A182QG48_9DIPT